MKVCYKAGAVTAQNHYYSIAADAVEIRVWFLTDDIIRIRAGFDGDWDEASYSLVTTAWESRTDELMKDYRKRINVAEAALVDGETKAVITGKKLRVEVEKDPFRICVYDAEGTMLHADIPELAYREDSNRRRIHTSQIEDDDYFYGFGEKGGEINKAEKYMNMAPGDAMGYNAKETDSLCTSIFRSTSSCSAARKKPSDISTTARQNVTSIWDARSGITGTVILPSVRMQEMWIYS